MRRWRFIPKVSYHHFKEPCFNRMFAFERRWGGKIWNFYCYKYQLSFDFRYDWMQDMKDGGGVKQ